VAPSAEKKSSSPLQKPASISTGPHLGPPEVENSVELLQTETVSAPPSGCFPISPLPISTLALSPAGRRAISGSRDVAYLWHVPEKRLVRTFRLKSVTLQCAGFSPDGKMGYLSVAGFKDNDPKVGIPARCFVFLFDVEIGKQKGRLTGH